MPKTIPRTNARNQLFISPIFWRTEIFFDRKFIFSLNLAKHKKTLVAIAPDMLDYLSSLPIDSPVSYRKNG